MPCPALVDFLVKKHSRRCSTQIVEDGFNRQKRKKAQASTRRLNCCSNFEVLLDRGLVDKVHHYDAVPSTHCGPERPGWLPQGVFDAPLKSASIELGNLTSFKPKTDWYSPGAVASGILYADNVVLEYAHKTGQLGKLGNLWLCSCFCQASNKILLREKLPGGGHGKPFFAIGSCPGSSGLGWPAEEIHVPGYADRRCWVPSKTPPSEHREVFLVLLDLHQWEAVSFEWRSPVWQQLEFPRAAGKWPESIRAISDKGQDWKPLLETAARAGFWTLDKDSSLKPIAAACGLELMEGSTVFETTFQLVKHVLSCSDEECVPIMQLRAAMVDDHEAACLDALLEMDECVGMLDKEEEQDMRQVQAKAKIKKADYIEFLSEYRRKRQEVMPAPKAVKGRGRGRGRGSSSATYAPTYPPIPHDMITQPMAKSLAPPGGAIWRGLFNGTWQCYYKPFPRKSVLWTRAGDSNAACLECLKYMWELHLGELGLDTTACPVQGLFPRSGSKHVQPRDAGSTLRAAASGVGSG